MAIIDNDFFDANMTQLGLKQSFSPKEEALTQMISEASEWVENYLQRKVEQTTVIESLRGAGYDRLVLEHWPVLSLTSINWEDDNGTSGSVDLTKLRILKSGILEWKSPSGGPWYTYSSPWYPLNGPWLVCRTYTVTYTTGMNPIPQVIKRATALKVVDLFQPMYQGARDQRSIEFVSNIEVMISDLLEPYRRERLG